MIYFILFFGSFIIHGQTSTLNPTKSCEVCIIGSTCTDDQIYFNVSISSNCREPLDTHFTYHTDVNSKPYNYNTTSTCSNCYIIISINPINQAWDYILTLLSPIPSKTCPTQHVAHCGGHTSQLSWSILGGLSGLAVLCGVLFRYIKYYCDRKQQVTLKKKKIKVAIINS